MVETAWDIFNVGLGISSFIDNVKAGNYGWAAVDALGVLVDGVSAAIPMIPGGVGTTIKIGREGAELAADVAHAIKYEKVNVNDPAANLLAQRLGGVSSVKFPGRFKDREFDVFTDEFIGQSKPANFQLGSAFRRQAQGTFEAAIELGRKPYFHFDGPPGPGVIDTLNRYSKRYGIEPVIDTNPL